MHGGMCNGLCVAIWEQLALTGTESGVEHTPFPGRSIHFHIQDGRMGQKTPNILSTCPLTPYCLWEVRILKLHINAILQSPAGRNMKVPLQYKVKLLLASISKKQVRFLKTVQRSIVSQSEYDYI